VEEAIFLFQVKEFDLFTLQPPGDILKSLPGPGFRVQGDRLSTVGADHDTFIFRHDPYQLDRQKLKHIFGSQHVALFYQGGIQTVNDQPRRPFLFRLDQPDDPVSIPNR
jgi:hypothetical protein